MNGELAMRLGLMAVLLCSSVLCMPHVRAAEGDMHFRGGLRAPPPCTVNNGAEVAVDFGLRVGINKVDGDNYRQAVNYRVQCDEPGALPWEVVLTLKGSATGFDKAAVQTNKTYLGVRVYQNGIPFTLNSSIKIDPSNPPQLEAVPVAKPGEGLTEGAFAATATLEVEYQ